MLNLDLSNVQEGGEISSGEHVLTVVKAEVKDTKSGTGQYINVQLKNDNGQVVYHMFNIKNQSEKAQQIGLSQLKSFLKAANLDPTRLTDVTTLEGAKVLARVALKEDDTGTLRARITSFKQAPSDADKNPFGL